MLTRKFRAIPAFKAETEERNGETQDPADYIDWSKAEAQT
jgi:hypothetical protein